LAGLCAGAAFAQVIIQPNLFQSPLLLVENRDVQIDLNLSDDQLASFADLAKKYADSVRGLGFPELDKRKKANEAAQKRLGELLTPMQAKRLKQLEIQQRGAGVLADPQVVKDLAITNEQRGDIITILQSFQTKWVAIFQAAKGNQQEIQKKLAPLHGELIAKVMTKLTPEQQAKWRDIAGPPFKGTFTSMMPVIVDMRPQPTLTWHMNDLNAALAEAKKTGKPVFVTFRCES
jgi:hypothetical protein